MKAAAILGVYALGLLAGGAFAYASAPAGANAKTALIVPAVCAAVVLVSAAMAAMLGRSRRIGMIGIHLGLVITLLFAVVFAHRAWKTHQAVTAYQQSVPNTPAADAPPATDAAAPAYDKSYLRNTLAGLSVWSIVAFAAMLAARPKPTARLPAV